MSDPTAHPSDRELQEQKRLLAEAGRAAAVGDAKGMLTLLAESRILDGLNRRLGGKAVRHVGRQAHPDDVDLAIGLGTDALFEKLSGGGTVRDVGAYIFRAAEKNLIDLVRVRKRERSTGQLADADDGRGSVADELIRATEPRVDWDAKRREAFRLVRELLPRLGQIRVQQVMEIVVDAAERNVVELPDSEIAEALGISRETAKKARQRGFQRLERLVRQEGLGEKILVRLRESVPGADQE